MQRYSIEFHRLPVGTAFSFNGNACIKRSTRTAEYTAYNRRFYFARMDRVVVSQATRDMLVRQGC
jgi:hypothetical protein